MANEKKESTRRALEKFFERDAKRVEKENGVGSSRKKKNEKPEKNVERACVEWMRGMNWEVEIFEAKSTFDPRRGVWRNQSMKAGVCDCLGTMPCGTPVAIEFKALGKLATFSQLKNTRQIEYLTRKIEYYAFGAVVDSVDRLIHIYNEWSERSTESKDIARMYLLEMLPRRKLDRVQDGW